MQILWLLSSAAGTMPPYEKVDLMRISLTLALLGSLIGCGSTPEDGLWSGPAVVKYDESHPLYGISKSRGESDPFEGKPTRVGPNLPDVGQTYIVDANANEKLDDADYVYVDRENDGILDLKADISGKVLWERDPKSKDVLRVDPVEAKADETEGSKTGE
jgi:hypothetical protein